MVTIRTLTGLAALVAVGAPAFAAPPATEPSLTGGSVLTATVNVAQPPGQAAVSLRLSAGSVGITEFGVTLTSPSGLHSINSFASLPNPPAEPAHQTVDLQIASPFANGGLGIYSEPGVWTVTKVLLLSKDNMFISYSGTQLTALFPSVNVNVINNGTPDIKPPQAGQGTILTPTVSLSGPKPYFAARLRVADAISGVANASISYAPQNGTFSSAGSAYAATLAPLKQGMLTLYSPAFASTATTGTYSITGISACDYAQNCVNVTDPAQIAQQLGANTFQVTQ